MIDTPIIRARNLSVIFRTADGPRGIRINSLAPGFIDSIPAATEVTAAAPLARQGSVEEIAATVAFLMSDGAGYITGQTLRVDGGIGRGM